MIDINKEAEEWSKKWCLINSYNERDMIHSHFLPNYETTISLLAKGVIAGHNSKATQAKVIQGQIDVLKELDEINITNSDNNFGNSFKRLRNKIKKLQQKLKQLKNE
jgi:hypothetical protein